MASSVTFTIATPPSVNAVKRPANGRLVNTGSYRAWLRGEAKALAYTVRHRFDCPVRVEILLPRSVRGDIDNRAKAALDLLQKAGVISNDRLVDALSIARSDVLQTTITIESMEVAA